MKRVHTISVHAMAFAFCTMCVILFCTGGFSQLDPNSPWPMFQADVRHTAQSLHGGSVTGRFHWSYQFEGDYLESQPSVGSDGRVYVGTYDNNVTALSSEGALVWSYRTGSSLDSVPAIGADLRLFVGSHDNRLYALTPGGGLAWSYRAAGSIRSSPSIGSGGRVYTVCTSGNLYKLMPSGALLWSYDISEPGEWSFSSPALGENERVYAGSDDNNLYAVNSSGVLAWSYRIGNRIRSAPAVGSAGQIYAGTSGGSMYELKSSGALSWSYSAGTSWYSPAVGSDGRVYVSSAWEVLYVLAPNSSLLWSYGAGGNVSGSAIDAGGRVYFGSYDNTIRALLSDGTMLWSYTMGYYNYVGPVIANDGTVYQASADKALYCFRDPTPTPTPTATPTPTETPLPNYVNLEASPTALNPGEAVTLSYLCDFSRWNYEGVPVDIYLAAVKNPRVIDAPSSVTDCLSGGTVYLYGRGMKSAYRYTGTVKEPTWRNVVFPPAPILGAFRIVSPSSPAYTGDYIFATAFIHHGTGRFVRDDGMPVENSNLFTIRQQGSR